MSSRKEQKEALRAQREQREQLDQAAHQRRQRLRALGGAALLALIVLVVAILVSQSGSDDGGGAGNLRSDSAAVRKEFAGISQSGTRLGDPDAPATLVEYADLQCPFCARYSNEVLPTVLKDYVRDGRVRLDLRLLTFVGADSEKAARVAAASSLQNRMWQFVDLFYRNQGVENSGYVTDGFLEDIADATPGLDANEALDQQDSETVSKILAKASSEAELIGVNSTPSFVLEAPGKPDRRITLGALDPKSFSAALDDALQSR